MDLFQANSDTLKEVADSFRNQADEMQAALESFRAVAEDIRDHAWIGLGANTFFDEFDTELVPDAEKLIANLEFAANGIDKVIGTIEDGIQLILSRAKSPI